MAARVCECSCEGRAHAGPVFHVVLLAVQTTRGAGTGKRDTRKAYRKTVGYFCGECLLAREYTVEGRDMVGGRVREA